MGSQTKQGQQSSQPQNAAAKAISEIGIAWSRCHEIFCGATMSM